MNIQKVKEERGSRAHRRPSVSGWEVPCCWHAPGARRISSLALYACRQHSLHGWPLVCAFRRGREERQFLSALCFCISSFWRGGGGSTTHRHRNDLEVSRTYGNTQISTSRMLRKYLVYGTPWCTDYLASSIYSTVRFICGWREVSIHGLIKCLHHTRTNNTPAG